MISPKAPVIEVLLATRNGERFLREQIDSILAQSYPNVRVLARDDGSSDGTVAILEGYARSHADRFRILPTSAPTGSAKGNFLRLLEHSAADYVSFADQDDVWLPDKLSRSMEAMLHLEQIHGSGKPLLVFTDLVVVDDQLRTLNPSLWAQNAINPRTIRRLGRVLGENVVTGCTALINRSLQSLAKRMAPAALMHDHWIALIAASMGAAAPLPRPTVLYRQHSGNVIGAASSGSSVTGSLARVGHSLSRRQQRGRNEQQAEAFLATYSTVLDPASRQTLQAYVTSGRARSGLIRLFTMLRFRLFRHGLRRNLATALDLLRAPSLPFAAASEPVENNNAPPG